MPQAPTATTPVPAGGKTSRVTPITKPSGVDPLILLQERENRCITMVVCHFVVFKERFHKEFMFATLVVTHSKAYFDFAVNVIKSFPVIIFLVFLG